MRLRAVLALTVAVAMVVPTAALAHKERPTDSPPRPGAVPDQNRTSTESIDVCKTGECLYKDIQAAVNAAHEGALIRVWPGFYQELPSRAAPELPPDNPDGTWSFAFHAAHPNAQSLIGIIGKKNITLRGMGAHPRDVVIDGEFKKHVGIRGDRSDGLIIENLSVWNTVDHNVYVLETDGFVIDRVHSGWAGEYSFLTFANDHGLMKDCEAFGAGDAGLYPGGAADAQGGQLGRYSMEISHCKAYHNVLGYSGTQGDNVWIHDSDFYDNAVGLVTDSETDHPNYPQNNLMLERNRFHDNNFNVYSTNSDIRAKVFEDEILIPMGVGVLIASGNDNTVQNNDIWNNSRYGVWLLNGIGLIIGPTSDPPAPPFVSEGNHFLANRMYNPAAPAGSQNAIDFAWDGIGLSDCWQDNLRSPDGQAATTNGFPLPPCNNPIDGSRLPVTPGVPYAPNLAEQAGLTYVDTDGDGKNDQPICNIIGTCPEWDAGPTPEHSRNLPEGYQPPPTPPECGPAHACTSSAAASQANVRGTKIVHTSANAAALPATGVGTPTGLAVALIVGAAAVGAAAIAPRFRKRRP